MLKFKFRFYLKLALNYIALEAQGAALDNPMFTAIPVTKLAYY